MKTLCHQNTALGKRRVYFLFPHTKIQHQNNFVHGDLQGKIPARIYTWTRTSPLKNSNRDAILPNMWSPLPPSLLLTLRHQATKAAAVDAGSRYSHQQQFPIKHHAEVFQQVYNPAVPTRRKTHRGTGVVCMLDLPLVSLYATSMKIIRNRSLEHPEEWQAGVVVVVLQLVFLLRKKAVGLRGFGGVEIEFRSKGSRKFSKCFLRWSLQNNGRKKSADKCSIAVLSCNFLLRLSFYLSLCSFENRLLLLNWSIISFSSSIFFTVLNG